MHDQVQDRFIVGPMISLDVRFLSLELEEGSIGPVSLGY